MEAHCLLAVKILHHHANCCFDLLISGHQSVNPFIEAISILFGKYKRFMFVHPVSEYKILLCYLQNSGVISHMHTTIMKHANDDLTNR